MNSRARSLIALLAFASLLVTAAPAMGLSRYAEPAFTKATTNSFWYRHQSTGVGEMYCWRYRVNGGAAQSPDGSTCWTYNSQAGVDIKRTLNVNSGSYYSYWAESYVDFDNNGQYSSSEYYPCGSTTCTAATTIDNGAPQITTWLNGTDQYTRNPIVNLQIAYQDAISPPWYGGNNGYSASNWVRLQLGSASDPGVQAVNYSPGCSNKEMGNHNTTNSFSCTFDLTSQPDGQWFGCARSADAAVADNPSGTNQFVATSVSANISNYACGNIILDRGAPAVTANSNASQVTVGQLVNFSASATDSLSGVPNGFTWDFGDNTSPGSGATTTHTYTQAGTYVAKARTTDGAGNQGEGTKTITVVPAGSGATTNPGPGTTQGTTGVTPTTTPVSTTIISQQAGGGGAQSTSVGDLTVIAPKKLTAGKRSLLVALTPESAGNASVALLKGAKVVSKKSAKFGSAGTYSMKLKLPRKLKAGAYKLKISFTPTGASKASTKTLKLKVVAPKKRRSARKVFVVSGAPAKYRSGVPYHGPRR